MTFDRLSIPQRLPDPKSAWRQILVKSFFCVKKGLRKIRRFSGDPDFKNNSAKLQLDLAKAEIGKIIHPLGALGCHRCGILGITGCIGALRHAGRPRAAGCTIAAATVTAAVSIVVAMLRTVPAAIAAIAAAAGTAARRCPRRGLAAGDTSSRTAPVPPSHCCPLTATGQRSRTARSFGWRTGRITGGWDFDMPACGSPLSRRRRASGCFGDIWMELPHLGNLPGACTNGAWSNVQTLSKKRLRPRFQIRFV